MACILADACIISVIIQQAILDIRIKDGYKDIRYLRDDNIFSLESVPGKDMKCEQSVTNH